MSADQPHSREELAALLWPDAMEVAARKNLRQALTTLRASLANEEAPIPFLLISREAIQFNRLCDYSLDVDLFNQRVAACKKHAHERLESCPECLDRLTQAALLFRGELLRGFSIPDSLPFEEWLLLAREGLNLQMIDVLAELACVYESTGQEDAALQIARRRLVYEPWNEDAYRTLMRVLARRGQRTAALAEYERCKRVLAEELGIEPSKETLDLYRLIQQEISLRTQHELKQPAALPKTLPAGSDQIVSLADEPHGAMLVSPADCAYAAGLLEAEGSISLARSPRERWPSPQVSIVFTNRELADWLKARFGGVVTTRQQSLTFEWRVSDRWALRFLQHVRPYLVTGQKTTRCSLLLHAYIDFTPRNGRYSEEMEQKKRELLDKFASLG